MRLYTFRRAVMAAFAVVALTAVLPQSAHSHGSTGEPTHDDSPAAMRNIEPLLRNKISSSVKERDPAIRKAAGTNNVTPRSIFALNRGVSPLASTWCGQVVGHDRLTNAVQPHSRKQLKVIYAHPADMPNRLELMAPFIQHALKLSSEMIVLASGGTKGLAIDLGTECGSNFVDIQSVALPVPAASLTTTKLRFDVSRDVITALRQSGAFPMDRNVLVFIDHTLQPWGGGGMAEMMLDSRPDPAVSWHALGGRTGVVYMGSSADPKTAGYGLGSTSLHEIMHMLGAVQPDAPNSTKAGHCTDTVDLLCYDDGAGMPMREVCPKSADHLVSPLDCNGDDYFNPDPPAGSYLATNWNTYNSPFLCIAHECWAPGTNVPLKDPRSDLNIRYGDPDTETSTVARATKPQRVARVKRTRTTQRAVRISWSPRPTSERVLRYQIRRYVKGQRPRTIRVSIARKSGRIHAKIPRISRDSTVRVRAFNAQGWSKLSKSTAIARRSN